MRKLFSLFLLVSCVLNEHSLADQAKEITCIATGKKLRRHGSTDEYAQANLNFKFEETDGRAVLKSIRGKIAASMNEIDLNSYVGSFNYQKINNNPNYNPHKYYGYYQFPLDASESDQGMWGNFVIPFGPANKFNTHYIFQAGDHMGGTIDMDCTTSKNINDEETLNLIRTRQNDIANYLNNICGDTFCGGDFDFGNFYLKCTNEQCELNFGAAPYYGYINENKFRDATTKDKEFYLDDISGSLKGLESFKLYEDEKMGFGLQCEFTTLSKRDILEATNDDDLEELFYDKTIECVSSLSDLMYNFYD